MLTMDALLGAATSHAVAYDTLPAEHKQNLKQLLDVLHDFETIYGKPLVVSSGYRTAEHNTAIGGAPHSNHLLGKACDFADSDGAIDAWCTAHPDVLAKLGLWQEHPDATKGWCHLDTSNRPIVARPGCTSRQFRP